MHLSPKQWVIFSVLFVLLIALIVGGSYWRKGAGETQIRELLEQTKQRYEADIAAKDSIIKSNEQRIKTLEDKVSQASARVATLQERLNNIKPPETDEELLSRYEKLGLHPIFR